MLSFRDYIVSTLWYWASISNKKPFFSILGNPIIRFFLIFLHYLLCVLTSNDLSVRVEFKSKPRIFHAIGIIIGSGVKFGKNVTLRAHVCIGEKFIGTGDAPTIGDNVEFGIGAKIFGQVTIENNSILKSNSLTI